MKQLFLLRKFFTLHFFLILLACTSLCLSTSFAADSPEQTKTTDEEPVDGEPKPPTAQELWEKANIHVHNGDQESAAQYFYTVFKRFPEDVNAAASLWNTAQIRRDLALNSRDADWERVRNLFRLYINYFPSEQNAADAYLELGKTYYFMRLYREAVSYFKLFLNKYPNSSLNYESKRWLGEAFSKIGQIEKAKEIFQGLIDDKDKVIKRFGFISMGDLHFMEKEYRQAKDYYQMVVINYPEYFLENPDILRKAGVANIRYGKKARGRDQLYHYLNLVGESLHRLEVLFELGDSYLSENDIASAQKLYKQVVEEGKSNDKEVYFSNLRMAQFLDNPQLKLSKWQKANDLKDVKGDEVYLKVLDRYFSDPLSQDARYGLFMRYKARGDLDKAYSTGRDFLRTMDPVTLSAVNSERVGNVLLYLTEELLNQKRYQDIYDLYFVEYRHVKDYPDGTILYEIGQALEALNLFDKAAIVYYRAMKWPLADDEKIDLYYRRARVYLELKDYEAADRLLKHLRKLYKGTDSIGEVYSYSGKLYEFVGDKNKALDFYTQAAEKPTFADKLPEYADDALRLFLQLNQEQRAYDSILKMREKGLDVGMAQDWLLKVGNAMRMKGQYDTAVETYNTGLQEPYPLASNSAQAIHLYLGDCYFALGDKEKGVVHYTKANEGESAFWKKMALERLNQNEIDRGFSKIKSVSGDG